MDQPDAEASINLQEPTMSRIQTPRFAGLIDRISPVVLVFISLAVAGATAVGA
ncbi:MAG: hypothetical protein ACK4YQ_14875 [Phenylobacterium sp.]|uniref:hypothetical protein n=1 Tax=Phenylobacterium sp. TaxID=1871053 RepID=UPI00391CAF33